MSKNGIDDLRDHLFAALEGLADKEQPMDIDRAKAISEVAKTIIESAKAETDLLRVTGGEPASKLWTKKPLPGPKLVSGGG